MDGSKELLLRKMLNYPNKGLFSPANLFNGIGNGKSEKEIHELITDGFVEEVLKEMPHSTPGNAMGVSKITFYRLSRNGKLLLSPFYIRIWNFIKDDFRTIIITIITSVITTAIAIKITALLDNQK